MAVSLVVQMSKNVQVKAGCLENMAKSGFETKTGLETTFSVKTPVLHGKRRALVGVVHVLEVRRTV